VLPPAFSKAGWGCLHIQRQLHGTGLHVVSRGLLWQWRRRMLVVVGAVGVCGCWRVGAVVGIAGSGRHR